MTGRRVVALEPEQVELIDRVRELPKDSRVRRAILSDLGRGETPDELGEMFLDLVAKGNSQRRVDVAVAVNNSLAPVEKTEVLARVEYEVPPLVVAYDRATPKERQDLNSHRPAQLFVQKTRGKKRPEITEENLAAMPDRMVELVAVIAERSRKIEAGVMFEPQDQDRFRHECGDLLGQILGSMGRRSVRSVSPYRQISQDRERRWNNATRNEQTVWRHCSSLRDDPEIVAMNEAAKSDPPVGPNSNLRSHQARFG